MKVHTPVESAETDRHTNAQMKRIVNFVAIHIKRGCAPGKRYTIAYKTHAHTYKTHAHAYKTHAYAYKTHAHAYKTHAHAYKTHAHAYKI